MEFVLKKETCRNFLDNYHEEIYPILLPKIIEIGILTLKLSFDKVLFSPDELNEIIDSLNEQYILQKKLLSKKTSLKKLKNKYLTLENDFSQNERNLNRTTLNKLNNKTETNYLKTFDSSNFYDTNYFVPQTKSFRNEQLYNKRLENPMFNTLNKKIYPFWWWNQSEPEYLKYNQTISFNNEQKLSKSFNKNIKNEKKNKNVNMKNYFALNKKTNKTNYKISYDKNLNVVKVETGKKKKIKNNK
jgi:hypothetical protein